MLRHDHNREKPMVEEKSIHRHESHHGRLNRKSTLIIDQLKTKVKRKRLSKQDTLDLYDETLNQNINGNINNNNNKQSEPNHHEYQHKETSTVIHTQSTIPSITNLKESAFDNNGITHDDDDHIVPIENNEQDVIVPNEIHNDEDIEENVQQQRNSTKSDKSRKLTRSQLKSNSVTEIANHSNTKKRRSMLWHTSFQIRDEDFHTIFNDLPSDEQLIIAYPCAWKKDVFMHGRIFLSFNYLLFYACFFKWEQRLCISYKDIISVKRENSAIVLPNAIKLRTKNQDEYLFATYIPREKIFISIFRLWQNALLDQPLDYRQIRAFVLADQYTHNESSDDSEENNDEDDHRSRPRRSNSSTESFIQSVESPTRTVEPPTQSIEPLTQSIEPPRRSEESSRRTISFKLDDENITYLRTCTCESHPGKTYADKLFSFNVDTLFELLFGDNSFTRDFHKEQKLIDYTFGEWILNTDTGKRERLVTYKTVSQSVLGTSMLSCREKQTLEVEKPHLMYILNTEVYNEGIRYTDTFYVATRFCMIQYDAEHSSLRITAEMRYIKHINGFIKTILEKVVSSSMEGGVNKQVQRLANHQVVNMEHKSNHKLMPPSQTHSKQSIDNIISQTESDENSSVEATSSSEFKLSLKEKTITDERGVYNIGLVIIMCFLFVHIYLWYKLNSIEQALLPPETIVN
ncbi:unnamed protein product [Rotaria sp. Silwood1]|nr:unnamed protein product [Rotaria sp. Silwood1]CAF1212597.1 unnamed protein product [Rotaria sp. Silwood1]CAF4769623.1 unnamed protein product [Rotaria sp. Silwood1]